MACPYSRVLNGIAAHNIVEAKFFHELFQGFRRQAPVLYGSYRNFKLLASSRVFGDVSMESLRCPYCSSDFVTPMERPFMKTPQGYKRYFCTFCKRFFMEKLEPITLLDFGLKKPV